MQDTSKTHVECPDMQQYAIAVLHESTVMHAMDRLLIPGGKPGVFRVLGLLKALIRYLPNEQGACAKIPAMSRAYLWVVVKLASSHWPVSGVRLAL